MTCEVYLSTHPVGYSGSPSTVNETNCNKKDHLKFYHELHQFLDVSQFHQESLEEECHLRYCWGGVGSATCLPDWWWRRLLRETAARKSDRSRIGAFLPDLFTVRYHCPWCLLDSSVEMVRVVFFCKFVHIFALARSSQFWVAIHDRLGLWENDREYL